MGSRLAWLLLAFCLVTCNVKPNRLVLALTAEKDFYFFGVENGDTVLAMGDDNSSPLVALPFPVPLFGASGVNGVYVNTNGFITFKAPSSAYFPEAFPLAADYDDNVVAGYWTDLYTQCASCGEVTYRAITLPDETGMLDHLSIDVGYFYQQSDSPATFQIVIAMDTQRVFMFLLYAEDTTLVTFAQEGYAVAATGRFYILPGASTFAQALVTEMSNMNVPGKWAFGLSASTTLGANSIAAAQSVPADLCRPALLAATFGTSGGCEGQSRTIAYDIDNDGNDDSFGLGWVFYPSDYPRLTVGENVIRVTISAGSVNATTCPAENLIATLTLNPSEVLLRINSARAVVANTGSRTLVVGDSIAIRSSISAHALCSVRSTSTIDCGADSVSTVEGRCQYNSPGSRNIKLTATAFGQSNSSSISINVVDVATPICPNNTVLGSQACSSDTWSNAAFSAPCRYPPSVRPFTKLYNAFASRAPQDAAVIKRYYGELTIRQALIGCCSSSRRTALARESTAALLNSIQYVYFNCPLQVALTFRHTLYNLNDTARVDAVVNKFATQNQASFPGCPVIDCSH
eukprot:jgi/Chlat1/8602/Chrsp86S07998